MPNDKIIQIWKEKARNGDVNARSKLEEHGISLENPEPFNVKCLILNNNIVYDKDVLHPIVKDKRNSTKNKIISLRLSSIELDKLRLLSIERGLSVGALIRQGIGGLYV